jgi:hypothetical protein
MTHEEMAVLIAIKKFHPEYLRRPQLYWECQKLFPAVKEERLWLATIDACLAKGWICFDGEAFAYTLSQRGLANLKATLQLTKELVSSAGWVD